MRRLLAAALALAAAGAAPAQQQGPTWQQSNAQETARAARLRQALAAGGFRGSYALLVDGRRIAGGALGSAEGGASGRPFPYEAVAPLASVTKQVVAVLAAALADAGTIRLDAPAARYLPALGRDGPTVRQLLQHRSGLRNPEDSPRDAAGEPDWYTNGPTGLDWCLAGRGRPGGQWRYNNCDYVVVGALLERVTGRPLAQLYAETVAGPSGSGALFLAPNGDGRADSNWPGAPTPAERATLVRYGAAGGMVGTAEDVLAIDEALLDGRLLSPAARAELWRGDPKLGYEALGQWVFEAPLRGCPGPVRIVERRGAVGRFTARNVILPDRNTALVLLGTTPDDAFGEVWQGKGLSYDALSAAACP